MNEIDISNKPSPHSLLNKIRRMIWRGVYILFFRYTPNPFRRYRVLILKLMGGDISWKARVAASAEITMPWNLTMADYATLGPHSICYSTGRITIGEMATVSQYAYLCSASHDYEDRNFTLFSRPIVIEKAAWICARAMVGPGVTVREGAVLGANSMTSRDLEAWTVYGGTPAKKIKQRVIQRDRKNEKAGSCEA